MSHGSDNMFWKDKNEKLNIGRLNEVIKVSHHLLKILLILAIIALVVLVTYLVNTWHILSFLKTILIVIAPVFIGLIVAWLFDPIVSWLQKKGFKRILGAGVIYLTLIGGIYLLISLMIPALSSQINDFVSSIPSTLNYIKDFISDFLNKLSNSGNYDLSSIKDQIFKSLETFGVSLATSLPMTIMNIIRSIFSGGVTIVLGFMIGFYMLIDFPNVGRHLMEIVPKKWHKDTHELCSRLNHSLRGFVQGTLFIMLLVFIAQAIGLTLAGLKAPLVFAIFCAITNVIPYFGPYIGGIPAVVVALSISPMTGIFTLVSIVIVQAIESTFLQPIVMGKAMKLHPVTIMLGLLVFQYFFGILGMILATPLIASLKILIQFVDSKLNIMQMFHKEEVIDKKNIEL